MTDLRTAAQHALEACEQRLPLVGQANIIDELNALRAALAQEQMDAPLLRTMLPLTEEEMYVVEEEARKNCRLSQQGPRGQQITYWDGLTPWLIRATEKASWEKNHG